MSVELLPTRLGQTVVDALRAQHVTTLQESMKSASDQVTTLDETLKGPCATLATELEKAARSARSLEAIAVRIDFESRVDF